MVAIADILRSRSAPSSPVAAPAEDVPILHFLSHRKILALPKSSNGLVATIRSAQEQMKVHADLAFVVLRVPPAVVPAAARPDESAQAIGLKNGYRGQYYLLYERL